MFFFSQWEFSRESISKQALAGEALKASADMDAFQENAESQLGFEWEATNLVAMGLESARTSSPLSSLSVPPMDQQHGAQQCGVPFSGAQQCGVPFSGAQCGVPFSGAQQCPSTPSMTSLGGMVAGAGFGSLLSSGKNTETSDELKEQLGGCLHDIGKNTAAAMRIIAAADAIVDGRVNDGEDIMMMNLSQLKRTTEMAEELSLALTRAYKFQRMEGGLCEDNAKQLVSQSMDVSSKLAMCTRIVKAILPPARNHIA